jgi:hypothetical protein
MDEIARQPGHMRVDGERWLYCFKQDVGRLLSDNFDDAELCGLSIRRIEPLKRYELRFEDDAGNGFELDARFMVEPYDYADGVNASPGWVAANRYHRSWWAKGMLRLGGREIPVDCTGDSDHSWGKRDMDVFGANPFRMWSLQTPDGGLSLSAVQLQVGTRQIDLGFLDRDGETASIERIDSTAAYDANGVQQEIKLTVTDALGRTLSASFGRMYAYLGLGGPPRRSWGYEGVGAYEVEGVGTVPGLTSYFWPDAVTPARLHDQGA